MCIAKLLHLGVWICLYKFMYSTATEPIISIDFRRRVPKDLLSLYPSDRIIFSLKTRDRKEATRLARAESVRLDQEFERHGVTPASGILVHGGDNEHPTATETSIWAARRYAPNSERTSRGAGE